MKISILLTILFSIVTIKSFSQVHPRDVKRYYSDKYGFSILKAASWAMKENQFASVPLAFTNADESSINVVVEENIGNLSLESYFKRNLATMKSETDGFSLVKQDKISINGLIGYWIIFTDKTDNTEQKTLEYYLSYNGHAFIISCSSKKDSFSSHENIFKQVAESFKKE